MTSADRGFVPKGRARRAPRALPYAAGLLALAVTAGCTSGTAAPPASSPAPVSTSSSATTTDAPTTTTTPTPSVDPVIAKIPAAARPETMAGAEAFARFYMDQVNEAFTTGDPGPLVGLAERDCKVCSSFRNGAQELKDAGRRHKGQSIDVTSSSSNQYDSKVRTVVVWVTQNSVPVVDAKGKTVERTTAGKGAFLATLSFASHWTIARLQVVK